MKKQKKYILSDDDLLSSSYTIDRKNIYDTYKKLQKLLQLIYMHNKNPLHIRANR